MSDSPVASAFQRLPDYLGQHVLLSLSAMVLGLCISLPLGIFAARSRYWGKLVLAAASIIQTIPGLALLALFYPLLLVVSHFTRTTLGFSISALGFLPALLALTLYSMLPVLRNCVAALSGIDPAVLLAARSVGMTPWQSLFIVELPLAAPTIMAGLRIAAVWVIGAATLSTPIGQTSLGNYIFSGLQTENWVDVVFGCVAAALLALIVDQLLGLIESGIAARRRGRIITAIVGLAVLLVVSLYPLFRTEAPPVIIGTENFEEQYTLGDLIGSRLQNAGYTTATRDDLGTAIIFRALTAGDVDVIVNYSGTIWTNEMHRKDSPGRQQVLDQIGTWVQGKYGVVLLGPLGFENAYAFAMRSDRARALGIHSLYDLARVAPQLKIGGDYEFFTRPEWKSVVAAYGVRFREQRTFQPTFMYDAVKDGDVDVIAAFSSDGRIAQYNLKLLDDPKHALPPYDAMLLVGPRHAHDARFIAALHPLINSIDLSKMQQANLMVDRADHKVSPAEAAQWLADHLKHR